MISDLRGCERAKHTELVALRIGEHREALIAGLTDIGVLVVGAKVEVQPVLQRLAFRDSHEEQIRRDTVLETSGRRLEDHLVPG